MFGLSAHPAIPIIYNAYSKHAEFACSQQPNLLRLFQQWESAKPLTGVKILFNQHITITTLIEIHALLLSGADVDVVCTANLTLHHEPEAALLDAVKTQRGFASTQTQANRLNYFDRDTSRLQKKGYYDVVIDCDAGVFRAGIIAMRGHIELTHCDYYEDYLQKNGTFPCTVVTVDRSDTKIMETYYGTALGFINAFSQIYIPCALKQLDPKKIKSDETYHFVKAMITKHSLSEYYQFKVPFILFGGGKVAEGILAQLKKYGVTLKNIYVLEVSEKRIAQLRLKYPDVKILLSPMIMTFNQLKKSMTTHSQFDLKMGMTVLKLLNYGLYTFTYNKDGVERWACQVGHAKEIALGDKLTLTFTTREEKSTYRTEVEIAEITYPVIITATGIENMLTTFVNTIRQDDPNFDIAPQIAKFNMGTPNEFGPHFPLSRIFNEARPANFANTHEPTKLKYLDAIFAAVLYATEWLIKQSVTSQKNNPTSHALTATQRREKRATWFEHNAQFGDVSVEQPLPKIIDKQLIAGSYQHWGNELSGLWEQLQSVPITDLIPENVNARPKRLPKPTPNKPQSSSDPDRWHRVSFNNTF